MPYAQRLADTPIGLSLLALLDNHLLALVIDDVGAGCRPRRAIVQAIRPLLTISSAPLVSGSGTDPGSVSGLFNVQTLLKDMRTRSVDQRRLIWHFYGCSLGHLG